MKTKISKKTEHHEIIFSNHAVDSPAEVWMKLLNSMPSFRQMEKCDKCGEHETMQLTLISQHKIIIEKGFRALQKALNFHEITYNKRCQYGQYSCSVSTTEINYHIFIELYIRENFQSTSKSCKLKDLPTLIKFIAYCKRLSGLWEQYNDLNTKVNSCTQNETINPIAAIYHAILHEDN
ncbi:hypothetical protein P5V15_010170 [Pogonomyrmex californicus]